MPHDYTRNWISRTCNIVRRSGNGGKDCYQQNICASLWLYSNMLCRPVSLGKRSNIYCTSMFTMYQESFRQKAIGSMYSTLKLIFLTEKHIKNPHILWNTELLRQNICRTYINTDCTPGYIVIAKFKIIANLYINTVCIFYNSKM